MAKVKGKFIALAGHLMSPYKEAQKICDNLLFEKTGRHYLQLEQEAWYDTEIFNDFMMNYASVSENKEEAIVCLGKKVYPLIKQTVGFPSSIKTALDLIIFEAEGFELNHKGGDVIPRKFIKKEEGHVIVQAPAPGYSQKLFEGVFLGILQMYGIKTGKVVMTKKAPFFEYEITW